MLLGVFDIAAGVLASRAHFLAFRFRSRIRRNTSATERSRSGAATNCFIAEPLALAAHDRARGALLIGDTKRLAGVVPQVEFGNVAVQMMLAALLVHALHAALEHREEAFDGVGGHEQAVLVAAIFLALVVHRLMGREFLAN